VVLGVHVILGLIGIVAGFRVRFAIAGGRKSGFWTELFLGTTGLTSIDFCFPRRASTRRTPSISFCWWLGPASLAALFVVLGVPRLRLYPR
jgi:hypothetical protein